VSANPTTEASAARRFHLPKGRRRA